ncbi:MAG: universal stress protein [Rhodospirillales bacterium]|nr:universal stress protein [Rhodospirillales bacterium]
MQLRDILVVMHGANPGERRLAITLALARQHGARVTGFCPLDLIGPTRSALELVGYGEAMLTDQETSQPGAVAERAEQAEAAFRTGVAESGLAGAWVAGDADPPQTLLRMAHHADLVVVGQPDPASPAAGRTADMIEQLLLHAGRPLLLVPYAGTFDAVGSRVLIGWTETRECARAVHDALPLLTGATSVTALTILEGRHTPVDDEPPAAELARHLQRHGIAATAARTVTDGIADADALLSYACDIGVDLLIMGGYGHSPLRERMLGGVTRSLLRHMTVPVLMSH